MSVEVGLAEVLARYGTAYLATVGAEGHVTFDPPLVVPVPPPQALTKSTTANSIPTLLIATTSLVPALVQWHYQSHCSEGIREARDFVVHEIECPPGVDHVHVHHLADLPAGPIPVVIPLIERADVPALTALLREIPLLGDKRMEIERIGRFLVVGGQTTSTSETPPSALPAAICFADFVVSEIENFPNLR